MTRPLRNFLAALDWACWEDSEDGGDGWARVEDVKRQYGVTLAWAQKRLDLLVDMGMAERRLTAWVEGRRRVASGCGRERWRPARRW